MKYVSTLRKEIKKREPGYVDRTDRYLKMPFLVFYERKIYSFDGKFLDYNTIKFKRGYFLGPDPFLDSYKPYFAKSDTLRIEGRTLILSKRGEVYKK